MAITGTLDKIVWGGALCVSESWSCSVHLLHPGPADTVAPLAALKTACVNWFQDAGLEANKGATLEYVKINAVDPVTGRYLDPSHSNTLEFPPVLPSSTAIFAAPQLSVVTSLQTASNRGRGSKGRFYPPSPGTQPGLTGHLDPGFIDGYLSANVALIRAFNALIPSGQVVIFSMAGQLAQVVTKVAIGDVVDTQRRRRKSLLETYKAVAV